jgi:hypothetical protein
MDFAIYWRVFNAILGVSAFLYLMLDFRVVRHELNTRRIYLTFSLAGFLLALVVGSVENVLQNNPIGFRTAIATASTVWCLIGLALSSRDRPPLWKDFPR